MKILAIDIGTGTQDILLFDSDQPIENSVKLILPSPTEVASRRIRRATLKGEAIALTGAIQGGGPCHWALQDHLDAGGVAYATADAARTFDDELDKVKAIGVQIVSGDEAAQCIRAGAHDVPLRDLDLPAIRSALAAFEVETDFDGIAVGCLDHGNSPPGYSDRLFRFEHLARVIDQRNDLLNFAYLPDELPGYLTRARATTAAAVAEADEVAFMDTGPAAALGALQDERVDATGSNVVLNLGNMHTLCFNLQGTRVEGLYEHHTGEISGQQIAEFSARLATQTLRHEEVFDSKGHGAYYPAGAEARSPVDAEQPIVVTGPQRDKVRWERIKTCFVAPHGDMMVSGCFGLLQAFAERYPRHSDQIRARLHRQ